MTRPAPPVRPWPYQFLRKKNGVAGILTYERVASYIQSFLLEASAGQSRDHKASLDRASLGFKSRRFSWSRDDIRNGDRTNAPNLQATCNEMLVM